MEEMKRAMVKYMTNGGRFSVVLLILDEICRDKAVEYKGEKSNGRDLEAMWKSRADHFRGLTEKIKDKTF